MPKNMGASAEPTGLAGAEAPEPQSRLGPSDGIPSADERLAELLALEENWNSYRGRPVDRAVAERVRAFFPLVAKLGLDPWICPLSDGSLQIERAGTDDYCIEFRPDGSASVYCDGLSDRDALGLLSMFAQLKALDAAAQGIEAATAGETAQTGSTEGESPVAKPCAQKEGS
jgi:hypothetical protein